MQLDADDFRYRLLVDQVTAQQFVTDLDQISAIEETVLLKQRVLDPSRMGMQRA